MNVQQFNHLYDHQKTEVVLKAVFLAERMTDEHYIRLYSLGSFYIEVFFNNETQFIEQLTAFKQTDNILPYVQDVSIAV